MPKKVTDDEIKTALKGAILNAKGYDSKVWSIEVYKLENALDLINRLQAEKENLKDILYDAEGVNLVNYWHQQCKIAENGCRNFAEENKRLQAENEMLRGSKNSDDNNE